MRIKIGSQFVELVSARDAEAIEEPMEANQLVWLVRGAAQDKTALWKLRQLLQETGSARSSLGDDQVIDEVVQQIKFGRIVGRTIEAPRIETDSIVSTETQETYTAPPPAPVGRAPLLTDKCNQASYCEEQFRLAAEDGVAGVDCPVLNGGQCPT